MVYSPYLSFSHINGRQPLHNLSAKEDITVAPVTHSNKGCTSLITLLPPPVPEPPQLEPPSSPLSCEPITTSDSKESYAYIHKKTAYIHTQMSPSLATVEHPITEHCHILTGGDTTPQTLLLLKTHFTNSS